MKLCSLLLVTLVCAVLAACGGGGDEVAEPTPVPTPTPAPTPTPPPLKPVFAPVDISVPARTMIWSAGAIEPPPQMTQLGLSNETNGAVTVQARVKGLFTGTGLAGASGQYCVQLQYYIHSPAGKVIDEHTLMHKCVPAYQQIQLDELQVPQTLRPGEGANYRLLLIGSLDVGGGGMQVDWSGVSIHAEIISQ